MSYIKTKKHQIRFWLRLRPQTPLGELTVLPRPPSWRGGGLAASVRKNPTPSSQPCGPRFSHLWCLAFRFFFIYNSNPYCGNGEGSHGNTAAMGRDQPNSRFHGRNIFREIGLLLWNTPILWNSVKSVIFRQFLNFNAFTFIYEGFQSYQQLLCWFCCLLHVTLQH